MPSLKRAKCMIAIVAAGLFFAGVTIWPAIWELNLIVHLVWGDAEPAGEVHAFILQSIEALEDVGVRYQFLYYAGDWLAFAHIVLAILFLGVLRDPVRNVWIVQFGLHPLRARADPRRRPHPPSRHPDRLVLDRLRLRPRRGAAVMDRAAGHPAGGKRNSYLIEIKTALMQVDD